MPEHSRLQLHPLAPSRASVTDTLGPGHHRFADSFHFLVDSFGDFHGEEISCPILAPQNFPVNSGQTKLLLMSTENPQRITFWHWHIRTGPYACCHVARRRSHVCTLHYPVHHVVTGMATRFWRHKYIELPLLATSALHPSDQLRNSE
uniref:Uncharacterized protein n=1 Tax=Oryza brachyantha TaxID=4533 RepID=J3MR47_ORYBR